MSLGRSGVLYDGNFSPVNGISAMRPRRKKSPIRSVSEAIHRPCGLTRKSKTPTPRVRVGFHVIGRAFSGFSAARPCRDTAPGPAASPLNGLFCQRGWPPTYTTESVISTPVWVSPPVLSIHDGTMPEPTLLVSNRAELSQAAPTPPYAPVVTITK